MEQDLRGRTALVTGANSGVGLELTKQLLARGAEVAALVRSDFPSDEEASRARDEGRLRVYRADFADFASLKRGLAAVKAGEKALDLLFNNAGVAFRELRRTGNHEAHFVVNALVPFIVLEELSPLIEAGALKTVVQTSSNALEFVRSFSLDGLENPVKHEPLFGPYGASKLALTLWTREAAASWKRQGITVVSACPGGTKTKMTAEPQLWFMKLLFPLISHPASEGARRILQAALSGAAPGSFLTGPKGKVVEPGFVDEAPRVLALVRQIYEQEYLTATAAV
jgi:NAD(P)-dependent dehydrogenase (short-subunit alcohol dehydrogenase family)